MLHPTEQKFMSIRTPSLPVVIGDVIGEPFTIRYKQYLPIYTHYSHIDIPVQTGRSKHLHEHLSSGCFELLAPPFYGSSLTMVFEKM